MNLSDPNQPWWDPNAGLDTSIDDGASWYPNQASVVYGIPQEQHGYEHYPSAHSSSEGTVLSRSHRTRKRSEQNPDLADKDFDVISSRPVFSVPNVARTSKDGRYDFAESCHEFRASEGMPHGVEGHQNYHRKKSTRQGATHYSQEAEYDDDYAYEARRFEDDNTHRGNQEAGSIIYCPHEGCGFAGPDKNSIRKHIGIHGARKFYCGRGECAAGFHTARDLRRHEESIHRGSKASKNYICKVSKCHRDATRPFTRKDNARQHIVNVHVHEIGNARIDDFIEAIGEPEPPQRQSRHRPTGSSSTDDTVSSSFSYESNHRYHGHEDPEGEDMFEKFTYLQEYDSDLDVGWSRGDVGHFSAKEHQLQSPFGPGALELESQQKYSDPRPLIQSGRRLRVDTHSQSATNTEQRGPAYYQERDRNIQSEDLQWYDNERAHGYSDRSATAQQVRSQIKEESPFTIKRHYHGPIASTATKKPTKHLTNPTGKTYHPETSATTESLEAAFEKSLTI
ncbi:hypothetical protein TWF481_001950 [Arthrobotrys musiformis]|uniref:C2H2-type domain-containing protein n=1 Tax=Arthrobotrys musiformis TaxID=47236 RepID=A0AAV9VX72_9PEZI